MPDTPEERLEIRWVAGVDAIQEFEDEDGYLVLKHVPAEGDDPANPDDAHTSFYAFCSTETIAHVLVDALDAGPVDTGRGERWHPNGSTADLRRLAEEKGWTKSQLLQVVLDAIESRDFMDLGGDVEMAVREITGNMPPQEAIDDDGEEA